MRIAKMAPSTKVQGRWLCHLEDGTILRVGENEVLNFCLYADMELDDETVGKLTAAVAKSHLREKALNLISARPMSRKELINKLTARKKSTANGDDGYEGKEEDAEDVSAVAIDVADWLEGLGYLNDAEYAKQVARHYSAKGYGQGKIRDELWKRGVPRELWDEAKESAEAPEDGIDAFIRQKLRGRAPDPKELRRVSDALARRGYRWNEIKDGLRRYGTEIDEEST